MSRYCSFEMLMGSLVVGVLEVFMAALIATPNPMEPIHMALMVRGVEDSFAVIVGAVGLVTIWGSLRPARSLRHVGLALSAFVLLAVFGMVATSTWFSLSAGVIFVLALVALGLYAADAHIHVTEMRRANAEGP